MFKITAEFKEDGGEFKPRGMHTLTMRVHITNEQMLQSHVAGALLFYAIDRVSFQMKKKYEALAKNKRRKK